MAERAAVIADAKATCERARQFLDNHHPPRQWTEIMRALRVDLERCIKELEHG